MRAFYESSLTQLLVHSYVRGVVNSSDAIAEEVCDSDGEVIGQESTIFAVFEFISVLGEGRKFQRLLPPILPQLIYYLIAHMQITEAQVHNYRCIVMYCNILAYILVVIPYRITKYFCDSNLGSNCQI